MSLSDPISNLISNIRNAMHAHKETVDVPASKISERILAICKAEGYIEDFRLLKDNKQGILKIYLRYEKNKKPAIIGFKRVSRPGLRVYSPFDELPRVLNGLGVAIISTSKGVMADREARKHKVGGEVLCFLW